MFDHAFLSGGAFRCGSFIVLDRELLLDDHPLRRGVSILIDHTFVGGGHSVAGTPLY